MTATNDNEAGPQEREEIGSNPSTAPHLGGIVARRLSRRGVLGGGAAALALARAMPADAAAPGPSSLTFPELRHQLGETDAVADGYETQVLIRWGDAVLPDAPSFDPQAQSADSQALQFGYNNDFLAFHPLPPGSRGSDHGLLAVNHEYTDTEMMLPGVAATRAARLGITQAQARTEMLAHGGSVIEIRKEANRWSVVADSRYARRITADTEMRISGPAAGHDRMKTSADPTGTRVAGTLNNCAGGVTPWGTSLMAEENFNYYFGGETVETGVQAASWRRYGIVRQPQYGWYRTIDRFNLDKEPNEANRFGWVVEFDPYDPLSVPVKRTALGRFKHEGATHAIDRTGRVVFYSGDDERNDYLYKFVTARAWNPTDREANRDLLDEGTLYAARFHDDGTLTWLRLAHGEGPLTAENGFASQGDVLIETRRAADLVKATPMDRPEDVEANPATGRVYVMLTNNNRRTQQTADAANPRANNTHGHVIELLPPGAGTDAVDHAGTEARWGIFLLAGKPGIDPGARYHRATSDEGWLSCPDNCAFDSKGRIWIATDGAPTAAGVADGLYAADTTGFGRALTRLFYQTPTGAEVCGPCLTPDDRTVFLAIQHPGEAAGATFAAPATRWPDFRDGVPPRPSVIAIVKKDGGVIGS